MMKRLKRTALLAMVAIAAILSVPALRSYRDGQARNRAIHARNVVRWTQRLLDEQPPRGASPSLPASIDIPMPGPLLGETTTETLVLLDPFDRTPPLRKGVARLRDDTISVEGSAPRITTIEGWAIVYSIGPDGVDDIGGRADLDFARAQAWAYDPTNGVRSRGDIFAEKSSKGDKGASER